MNQGTTIIGRGSSCDIRFTNDVTLSREHVKIVEKNGYFRIIDLGSTNGTRLNGNRLRQPELLDADDEIQLGDNTVVRFVTSHR